MAVASTRSISISLTLLAALGVLMHGNSFGADWPQYRGPLRNDVSDERGLLQEWPSGGPALLWTYSETGSGLSGSAVVGDRRAR